jgi:ribonucleoside-diphosphate reductase beta chain
MRNKYGLYPIEYQNLWDMYKQHVQNKWVAEDIDYAADLVDLEKIDENTFFYLKNILGFFAQSDGVVNENLAIRFYKDVEIPEARAFYSIQCWQETVHAETYQNLIETYVKDSDEKNKLFNAMDNFPTIAKKLDWAVKWIDSEESFAKRLVAFSIVEGMFFAGSFCSIYWLRSRGLFKHGLSVANDFISRDELLHFHFASELFKTMHLEISDEDFYSILNDAVAIEKEFVTDILPVRLIGMNSDLMIQYIEYTADTICAAYNKPNIFNKDNPFDFMRMINMKTQKNFFEKRVSEYNSSLDSKKISSFSEDF